MKRFAPSSRIIKDRMIPIWVCLMALSVSSCTPTESDEVNLDLTDPSKADYWVDIVDPETDLCNFEGGLINWPDLGQSDPSDEDFNILHIVQGYQSQIPQDELLEIESWTHEDLLDGAMSTSWTQETDDQIGLGVREMVVEHTQGIIPVNYETFLSLFPPDLWGPNLDHYLAGEVRVFERDEQNRVVRQLERMVLNQVPYDFDLLNFPCINGDMTKVEVIVYEPYAATVYWRVMYSGNFTTESDIGSVRFEAVGNEGSFGEEEHTLVTFHSAHRLKAFGHNIPNGLLMVPLLGIGPFFEDHIDYYRELVTDVTCQDGFDSDFDGAVDCDDDDCDCGWW